MPKVKVLYVHSNEFRVWDEHENFLEDDSPETMQRLAKAMELGANKQSAPGKTLEDLASLIINQLNTMAYNATSNTNPMDDAHRPAIPFDTGFALMLTREYLAAKEGRADVKQVYNDVKSDIIKRGGQ